MASRGGAGHSDRQAPRSTSPGEPHPNRSGKDDERLGRCYNSVTNSEFASFGLNTPRPQGQLQPLLRLSN